MTIPGGNLIQERNDRGASPSRVFVLSQHGEAQALPCRSLHRSKINIGLTFSAKRNYVGRSLSARLHLHHHGETTCPNLGPHNANFIGAAGGRQS